MRQQVQLHASKARILRSENGRSSLGRTFTLVGPESWPTGGRRHQWSGQSLVQLDQIGPGGERRKEWEP